MSLLLMPNHIHLLIQCKDAKTIEGELIRVSRIHGGESVDPIWSCPIKNYPQLLQVYKYIFRNPVDSGLVRKVEEYPFSSLQFLLGKESAPFVILDPFNIVCDPIRILKWLNNRQQFSPYYPTSSTETPA